ncbi:sulfite exporter TauE/SafE family protein [Saccharothrix saharensis]|uniref:sulfite exporter TauE/SafE family protein n=1 Tax=Saccharothrix saharensis TaxID=571190 RepID=UPI0036AA0C30
MTPLILALVAGAVVGLSLGALGGGGSVLAVPALIYLLGFTPDQATTASLLVVAATSLTALTAHARSGAVRWRLGAVFALAGVVPAAAAGVLTRHVPAPALTGAFALIAAVAAGSMLRKARPVASDVRPVRAAGVGAGLGAMTGFLGVGGGFLAVPALVGVLAVPMTAAVGTSLLVITTNATVALTARLGDLALLDWTLIGPFAAAALLGAWDGKRLAADVRATTLQRLFAAVLLAVAAFMAVDAARRAVTG